MMASIEPRLLFHSRESSRGLPEEGTLAPSRPAPGRRDWQPRRACQRPECQPTETDTQWPGDSELRKLSLKWRPG